MKKLKKALIALLAVIAASAITAFCIYATIPVAGDVNGDGKVKGSDATMLLKYLADWKVEINELSADCNGDGKVNGSDATLLLKYLADWKVELTPADTTEWYNFTDWSDDITTDASTDVSAILQACINEKKTVFVPKGEYRVNSAVILTDGCKIKGEDGTLFRTDINNLFTASGTYDDETKEHICVKDISLTDFGVEADDEHRSFVAMMTSIDGFVMKNIHCETIGICNINSAVPGITEMIVTESDYYKDCLSRNILIEDCYADGNCHEDIMQGQYVVAVGLHLDNVRNITIRGCEVHDFPHGIQFFGGTSHCYLATFEMVGKILDSVIEDCTVYDIDGGGIWGTCARNLTLRNNHVMRCLDVGIDMEGCDECLVTGCTIEDSGYNIGAPSGNVGTVIFENNTSIQHYESDFIAHFDGHSSWDTEFGIDHQNIIIRNNTFITEGKIGVIGGTYYAHGPSVGHVTISNNKLTNTVISSVYYHPAYDAYYDLTYRLDMFSFIVEGNELDFDMDGIVYKPERIAELYPAAIKMLVNTTTPGITEVYKVNNNKITGIVGLSGGIMIEHGQSAVDFHCECIGNEIEDTFDIPIAIMNETENKLYVDCRDNICSSIVFFGDNLEVTEENNKNKDSKAVKGGY